MKQNKDLNALKEPARTRIKNFIDDWNSKDNIKIWVTETLRTIEQQREYVKTWASKTMNSNHLNWNAIDIFFNLPWDIYLSKRKDWDTIWRSLCATANKHGLVNWFYDLNWWFDKPHFQIWEVQKPEWKMTPWYSKAVNYRDISKEEIEAWINAEKYNWILWNATSDLNLRRKLEEINTLIRSKNYKWN